MENLEKGITVPKWVTIVWPKIPQMAKNLCAQFVLDFNKKRLHWASVVRTLRYDLNHTAGLDTIFVQIYMDELPEVPGVSKNQIFFYK